MIVHVEYHLKELDVARSPDDPRRAVPEIPEGCAAVLDVGCGAGQTLLAADLKAARACGVDCDGEALKLGKKLAPHIGFVRSSGEDLPFSDASFDLVISRVALPYMRIPRAVGEIARVLKPGGGIWFTLHPVGMFTLEQRFGTARRALYEGYRLANTAALHLGFPQIRYPLERSRTESYQTERGMRRLLEKCGFEAVGILRGAHFVITARKRGFRTGAQS